ncbi:SRPBCC domain-containing protein [Sphingobium nicotianae]|uniref:SRPBCC domain-containing protein n=1 Tax=Sphingobium nicotianae TaxID=2782607 RepID=A0A9X1DCZ3_9SPHN|nr:SRPBCC domain-containing protein [Sphingobium nicotianae]MBT2187641.1 SRPBCC domain-containing protein [Sphingobium nicotianae]
MPGRVDRAERLVKVPPPRTYAAFLDKAAVIRWLPPEGARGIMHGFEPHPGGAFRMTLVFEKAAGKTTEDSDTIEGQFVELTLNERIVWRFTFASADPAFAGTMTMRWTFAPAAGGTLVSVAAEDVPPGIDPADHQAGMTSSLDKLAAFLNG